MNRQKGCIKKSIGVQTTSLFADPKSLTYLIQGLISRSIAHFFIDERLASISGKTEGICRINSADPRLSSVSLYLEYELGNTYINQPHPLLSGYPLSLKSPFSKYKIVTGLDRSKTKFVDNDNYVIEFVEMSDFTEQEHEQNHLFELIELVKSGLNITEAVTGPTTASQSTKTVMTQTGPYVEDTKALTYITKGIMFKSICEFNWDEKKAFHLGSKKGIIQFVSSDPNLKSDITLTCNYKLSKCLVTLVGGDSGYPIIIDCSYGSVKAILTQDKKNILDHWDYNLTFLS
ncbi:20145_t:CDS:1 [Dentiscutata erythropus]|uniref:20145_t:CDS:1 n=1 Tax=Dentiscutata erythropus TaxID=1348616 RepID=A0A9N9C2M2_9GLOM|nr:20145_t:CDS:1 [Dentiscutata erythropus]